MKITGAEANKLIYIARFPRSEHSKQLARKLHGEAKQVADAIVSGSDSGRPEKVRHVVAALKNR